MARMNVPLKESTSVVRLPMWQGGKSVDPNQTFWNCYPKKTQNPQTGGDEYYVSCRNGFDANILPDVTALTGKVNDPYRARVLATCGFVTGTDLVASALFDESNGTIYVLGWKPYSNTTVLIGSFTGFSSLVAAGRYRCTANFIHLTEIAFAPSYAPILGLTVGIYGGTTRAYYANTTAGAFTAASLTQIVAAGFPTGIVGQFVVYQNFVFVATRSGSIYWSDSASISAWTSTSFVAAGTDVDRLHGLGRYKHHLMAFGDRTIEFFNVEYENTTGAILVPTNQARIRLGVPNSYSYLNVDDTLYFMAATSTGEYLLHKLDGYTPILLQLPKRFPGTTAVANTTGPKLMLFTIGKDRHICLNVPSYKLPEGVYYDIGDYDPTTGIPYWDGPDESDSLWEPYIDWQTVAEETESSGPTPYMSIFEAGLTCFSIETESIWFFTFSNPLYCFFLQNAGVDYAGDTGTISAPCMITATYHDGYTLSSIVQFNTNITDVSNPLPGVGTQVPHPFLNGSFSSYYQSDMNEESSRGDRMSNGNYWPIHMQVTSEFMDFNNTQKKRISRLVLDCDGSFGGQQTYRLMWRKEKTTPSGVEVAPIGWGVSLAGRKLVDRIQASNLGSSRRWAFIYWSLGFNQPILYNWEVHVTQGT